MDSLPLSQELVSNVSCLLLDEPTSGLDAFASYNIMDNLKEVAASRRLACLATIHAPSWRLLSLFDSVILLTRGGVFYSGPAGQPMIEYFFGIGHQVPEGQNPADHFITIAEAFEKTQEAEDRVTGLLESWKKHEEGKKNSIQSSGSSVKDGDEKKREMELAQDQEDSNLKRGWPTPWLLELKILTDRNFKQVMRDPALIYGTLGQTAALLIFIGFLFYRLPLNQTGVLSRVGALFIIPGEFQK